MKRIIAVLLVVILSAMFLFTMGCKGKDYKGKDPKNEVPGVSQEKKPVEPQGQPPASLDEAGSKGK